MKHAINHPSIGAEYAWVDSACVQEEEVVVEVPMIAVVDVAVGAADDTAAVVVEEGRQRQMLTPSRCFPLVGS
jgi:hypothetical protein